MKAFSYNQWRKMNPRQRSWLVCRALGEKASVFWHCTKPDGSRVGGSLSRRSDCTERIQYAQELTPKKARALDVPFPHPFADCKPVPVVSYPMYANYDHVGMWLVANLLKEHGSFALSTMGSLITASAGGIHALGDTSQEAVSLLVLKLKGFVQPYQP